MDKTNFFILLDKYLAHQCTPDEEKLIRDLTDQLQEDDWALTNPEQVRLKVYLGIQQKLSDQKQPAYPMNVRAAWVKYAAGIVLILGMVWLFATASRHLKGPDMVRQTAQAGEQVTVTLPDGSEVHLNATSSITYPKKFDAGFRQVKLQGEGFFSVKRNEEKPFSVITDQVKTTVLGTSFNIRSNAGKQVQVTVTTGKVRVELETKSAEALTLLPNQQATYLESTDQFVKTNVNSALYTAWMDDLIIFDKTPLSEVLISLEKRYNVSILLEDKSAADCDITGKYKNGGLKNILEGLKFMSGITYGFDEKNHKVTILGNPCKPPIK